MLRAVPKSPGEARDDIPDELCKIILRLLSKNPHLRYRECDQLTRELDAIK